MIGTKRLKIYDATETVGAAVLWALNQTGVKSVRAETEIDNIAYIKVLQKCGFIKTGSFGQEGPVYLKSKNSF